MSLTPDQARERLGHARIKMKLATTLGQGRVGFDAQAGLTAAVLEIIELLEDALV